MVVAAAVGIVDVVVVFVGVVVAVGAAAADG